MCKCGAVGVDGGKDYLRRTGHPQNTIDLSVVEEYEDSYKLEHSDAVVKRVHAPSLCVGQTCPIHHKTDNHMRGWIQTISHTESGASGPVMIRVCPHNFFHIDADESNEYLHKVGLRRDECLAGCDRCCEGKKGNG